MSSGYKETERERDLMIIKCSSVNARDNKLTLACHGVNHRFSSSKRAFVRFWIGSYVKVVIHLPTDLYSEPMKMKQFSIEIKGKRKKKIYVELEM